MTLLFLNGGLIEMRRTFPLADEYETDSIENKRFQSGKKPDALLFDEISFLKMISEIDLKYQTAS